MPSHVTSAYGEVRQQDEVALVQWLKAEGRRVAMAGDGINDAPALAAAHVGIAMGTGTDVAMSSAQVRLVKGDLTGIVRARRLSEATVANMRQNLTFAFIYNAIGVPIAAGVLYRLKGLLLNPMIAGDELGVGGGQWTAAGIGMDELTRARVTHLMRNPAAGSAMTPRARPRSVRVGSASPN